MWKLPRFAALLALTLATSCADAPEFDTGRLRIIHAAYGGPTVDVVIDGTSVATALAYNTASPYIELPAGPRSVSVRAADGTELLLGMGTLAKDDESTFVVMGGADSLVGVNPDDERAPNPTMARVRVIHAVPDAPALDLRPGSGTAAALVGNVAYQGTSAYVDVAPGEVEFVFTATSLTDVAFSYQSITLEAGKVYSVVLSGTVDTTDSTDVIGRVFIDNDDGTGFIDLVATSTPSTKAKVRVIHASYDAPSIDVQVDGSTTITDLTYGESSGYSTIDAGSRQVQVAPNAGGSAVIDTTLSFDVDKSYTVFAVDQLSGISAVLVEDDLVTKPSKAKLKFVHASPDGPAVDVKLDHGGGTTVFSNVAFKGSDVAEVDGGNYRLVVTEAGMTSELTCYIPVTLENDKNYTIVALGTVNSGDSVDFVVRVFVDTTNDGKDSSALEAGAQVMAVHASPDGPQVSIEVDDVDVFSMLDFPMNTGYLNVTAGTHKIEVVNAGSPVLVENSAQDQCANYTFFAANALANIEKVYVTDDLSPPATGMAHVRFAHLSPDAPAVTVKANDGVNPEVDLFTNKPFKDVSAFTPVATGTYTIRVVDAVTPTTEYLNVPNVTLTNGKIYTVFAKGFATGTPPAGQELGAEIIENR